MLKLGVLVTLGYFTEKRRCSYAKIIQEEESTLSLAAMGKLFPATLLGVGWHGVCVEGGVCAFVHDGRGIAMIHQARVECQTFLRQRAVNITFFFLVCFHSGERRL